MARNGCRHIRLTATIGGTRGARCRQRSIDGDCAAKGPDQDQPAKPKIGTIAAVPTTGNPSAGRMDNQPSQVTTAATLPPTLTPRWPGPVKPGQSLLHMDDHWPGNGARDGPLFPPVRMNSYGQARTKEVARILTRGYRAARG
jgi:hypothetical protein